MSVEGKGHSRKAPEKLSENGGKINAVRGGTASCTGIGSVNYGSLVVLPGETTLAPTKMYTRLFSETRPA